MAEHVDVGDFIADGTLKDIPGYSEEKQTIIDEDAINETLEPATNAFSGLREFGDLVIASITDFLTQVFGNLM